MAFRNYFPKRSFLSMMRPEDMIQGNRTNQDLLEEWNHILLENLIPNDVILLLYLVLGIFGNLVVILLYIVKMKVKRDDRFFIPVLASLDFIACLFGASFAFAWNMFPVRFSNGILCQVLWFVSQSSTIISGLTLIIIAVHRYIKVCQPTVLFTRRLKQVLIVISIVFGCSFSIPIFIFYGSVEIHHPTLNINGSWCGQKRIDIDGVIIYDITVVTFSIIATIVLAVLYILIGRTIHRKFMIFKSSVREGKYTRTRHSMTELDSVTAQASTSEEGPKEYDSTSMKSRAHSVDNLDDIGTFRRAGKRSSEDILNQSAMTTIGLHFRTYRYSYMFMVITVLFILAYAPRVTIMLLETLDLHFWDRSNSEIAGFLFLYRLYILNHVLNPFIYGFFDTRFRQEVKNVFCCCRK